MTRDQRDLVRHARDAALRESLPPRSQIEHAEASLDLAHHGRVRAAEKARKLEETRVIVAAFTTPGKRREQRCVYCGRPGRRVLRACGEHRSLLALDPVYARAES